MTWFSLPLGLLSWLLPIVLRNKKIKPTAVSAASLFLCILALLNVLWELYGRTASGDYSALMDITINLVVCSVALVIGTLLLNLWLHAPNGILRYLDRPVRFFAALLVTLVVQSVLYVPGMLLTAFLGDRLSVGSAVGSVVGLTAYAGAVPLLRMYWKKTPKERLSWGLPLGVLLSRQACSVLLSITYDILKAADSMPYEFDEAHVVFLVFYLAPMVIVTVCLVGKGKWDHWKQRRAEQEANPPKPRRLPRIPPFGTVLILQTLAFLPAPLFAINGGGGVTGYRMGFFYCSVPLGLAVVLLAVYLHKVPKEKLSFGVPLAVAAFLPVQYLLQSIPVLLGVQADVLPYEWDQFMNAFYPIYFYPVLLMTATSVGWLRLLACGKPISFRLPKLTFRRADLLWGFAVAAVTVLAMVLIMRSPDIQLEKGDFLMLESDAPMFFAVAFGVVTLLFGLFLLVVYRKREQKTGLVCFLLQWAFTLAAFYFLMTGLTLRPGNVGGMYTEHVSLNVGLAGLCWAASIAAMGCGLKQIMDMKKGEPHESD